MDKYLNLKPGTIVICIFTVVLILYIIGRVHERMRSFNGTVENVKYSIQHTPTVTIDGSDYYLNGTGWDFVTHPIEIGDKLIKRKGTDSLLLIKHNSRDTINMLEK